MDLNEVKKQLFLTRTRLYCVLDGVLVPDLPIKLAEGRIPHYCILPGELDAAAMHAAPYVAYLSPDSKFADEVVSQAFAKNWGILFHSHRSLLEMRRHFRALHTVFDESGNPFRFRYYDPAVLRKFLPTCNAGELKTFFGDVETFFIGSADGKSVETFGISNGALVTGQIADKKE
ncbi:MAG: DUF4123 domain-containing protein [Pyrinomonadaceae bacterium]